MLYSTERGLSGSRDICGPGASIGQKEKERNMKRFWNACLCGLLAAAVLSGCSQKTGSDGSKVELGEYKGVHYTPQSVEVTDEQVEAEIQAMLDMHPNVTAVKRAAKNGDVVNIDYVGKKDGVAFDGGTAEGADLELGSGSFIDGFEEGLIGASAGDKRNLDLTFPEDYFNEELAGQAVVFEVTVNEVKESTPAELNEEFVKNYTEYASVDEFRADTRAQMESAAAESAEYRKRSDVFLKVVENATVTVTDETVQQFYDDLYAGYEQQAALYGTDIETLLSYSGMDMETFQTQLREDAKTAAEQDAVARAIADKEKIKVEDADREELAEEFGYESAEAMAEVAGEDAIESYIITEKVVDFLAENAVAES